MKTYVIDIRYYISADNEEDVKKTLDEDGVCYSEYYGGYKIVDIEEEEQK